MNHSFLVHVSRTIPRSKASQSLIAQLQGGNAPKPLGSRQFSSHQTSPSVTFWGEGIAHSLRASPSKSIFVTLQPLRNPAAIRRQANRSASTYTSATMHLKERDPSDDPSGLPPSNGAAAGGQGENGDGWDDGKPPSGSPGAITRRPLFPGFYKAVVIKDPHVTAAIKELLKRGQPYIGAFLLKDEKLDVDTITSIDQIHPVGVFAQITSVFPASAGKDGKEDGGLTAVLYPHRRIKMTELLPMMNKHSTATVKPSPTEQIAGVEHPAVEPAAVEPAAVEPLLRTPEETPKEEEIMKTDHEPGMAKEDRVVKHQADINGAVTKDTQYATAFLAEDYAVSVGNVDNLVDPPYSKKSPIVRAITSEIVSVFKEIASLNPLFRDQIASFSMSQSAGNVFEEPAKLADFAAAVSAGEQAELQDVLETLPVEDRLQKALVVLKKELMNAQLQNKISKEVETKIAKRQREYYLMEQMKGIKKELGLESDGKDKLVEGFKEKATKLAMPAGVKKVFDEEINKLAHLEPAASEFNVTRNYLDWLTQVPWGQRSRENYNIVHAKKVLDEDHYGLQDVKDRILEFIAVGKLTGSVEGKIICLSGPPGVGKTSIGKSIARALDREFYRFSVGGLTDVAEIKGHRRTYVGAMPGKVIQALKKVQTENPLVLIDEIDKIGRGHQGDPSSALLELLDPEQNSSFLDHYMDVPVDLSKVLFVCTANVLDTIPGPLLDRMEVIQLSGYIAEEKAAIASKYLAPAAKLSAGLEHVDVSLTEEAVDTLIKSYCRESGVRNLKKHIDKVFRKAAFKVVQDIGEDKFEQQKGDSPKVLEDDVRSNDPEKVEHAIEHGAEKEVGQEKTQEERKRLEVPDSVHVEVTAGNLKDYVGPPIFHSDRLYEQTPPGVIMGLAWTSMGGSSLYIESVLESSLSSKSSPHLSTTGQLGDVMKESTTIAYTFAKSLMASRFPKNKFFEKARLHLHCPAGAVPKDGPSAGITMATSFISLALNKPISHNIAMTGELTVTGKVLQIGGLKEKTIAAKRSNVTTIMFPKDNQADWEELPAHVKKGITGIPVDYYSDVFKVCFGDVEKEEVERLWQKELAEDEKKDEKKD